MPDRPPRHNVSYPSVRTRRTCEPDRPLTPFDATPRHADDRSKLSGWLPPQWGVIPNIREGKRWLNLFWLIPLGFLLLVIAVAVRRRFASSQL